MTAGLRPLNYPTEVGQELIGEARYHLHGPDDEGATAKGPDEFYAGLLAISEDALKLRRLAIYASTKTWPIAWARLRRYEREAARLHRQAASGRVGVSRGQYTMFERFDVSFTGKRQTDMYEHLSEINSRLDKTFDEIQRTRQTITQQRTAVLTRMSIWASLGILSVSALTLALSVV